MESLAVSETYGAARELLERAEADAAAVRAEADRYRRQREQEAELLVAKARRLLAVAEQRAASIEAEAARQAPAPAPSARAAGSDDAVVDLTEGERGIRADQPVVATGLDRMLQSAIARAFDSSFHLGA
jgi:hypothetical protein